MYKEFKNKNQKIIDILQPSFDSLPKVPKKWTDILVMVLPYLVFITGAISLLNALSDMTFLSVIWIIICVLRIASFMGLKDKKEIGWNLLFASHIIMIIVMLISFELFSAVVNGFVGLYFLFQIKHYYK